MWLTLGLKKSFDSEQTVQPFRFTPTNGSIEAVDATLTVEAGDLTVNFRIY